MANSKKKKNKQNNSVGRVVAKAKPQAQSTTNKPIYGISLELFILEEIKNQKTDEIKRKEEHLEPFLLSYKSDNLNSITKKLEKIIDNQTRCANEMFLEKTVVTCSRSGNPNTVGYTITYIEDIEHVKYNYDGRATLKRIYTIVEDCEKK